VFLEAGLLREAVYFVVFLTTYECTLHHRRILDSVLWAYVQIRIEPVELGE